MIPFWLLLLLIPFSLWGQNPSSGHRPVLGEEAWRLTSLPDLGELNGEDLSRQHVVDHGFIQAQDGKWILWACMRGTKVGRLLYGWEADSLWQKGWKPLGVVARAEADFGEKTQPQESIQAPHFLEINGIYHCFYNSNGIRLMTSADGKNYQRKIGPSGDNVLYQDGGRDVMVMLDENTYYAYSTVSTVARDGWKYGFTIVRTSQDLKKWSDYTIVAEGGRAGNGPVSAESPFVVKIEGYYYLFRSSSITGTCFVYRSDDPYQFGVNDDRNLIAELPIKAPELIEHNGRWYISDLADFKGIVLRKLFWKPE